MLAFPLAPVLASPSAAALLSAAVPLSVPVSDGTSGSVTSSPPSEKSPSAATVSVASAALTPVGHASTIADNIVMQKTY